ncbi:MAG: ferrous iron transport protein B [Bacteroidetes bacterium]|nr:ferrous iron transport protein B [Bacteroidota bacterium]
MLLSEVSVNKEVEISKIFGRKAFHQRMHEKDIKINTKIVVIDKNDCSFVLKIQNPNKAVSIDVFEANLIEVNEVNENNKVTQKINVVILGNPTMGKYALFNQADSLVSETENYYGQKIEVRKVNLNFANFEIEIIDIPESFSISALQSKDDFIKLFLINKQPDIVVSVMDATNLEKGLQTATQLIDMDLKSMVVLNRLDELKSKENIFDYQSFSELIGIPLIVNQNEKSDFQQLLLEMLIGLYENTNKVVKHIHINYGEVVEKSIKAIQSKIFIVENIALINKISTRFISIKLIEKDAESIALIKNCSNFEEISETTTKEIDRIERYYNENTQVLISDSRYGFVAGAIKETLKPGSNERTKASEIIDTFFTHRLFGFPVFIFFMWLMFQLTFTVGSYPMHWIEHFVQVFSDYISGLMAEGPLKDLIVNGMISGVGGVVVFLPNILMLFFFISLMEETGYMSRAVFIMDKTMHRIGLHGKSFIPLIMGFGCNVPAIMATKTIENKNERFLTILINPFMSCSARLPVYVLFISAFFPKNSGTVLFLIYSVGVTIAVLIAILFKKTIFKAKESSSVMELPPYRVPKFTSILQHMWNEGAQYLKKIGTVILLASIIIWALGYFPKDINFSKDYSKETLKVKENFKAEKNKISNSDTLALNKLKLKEETSLKALDIEKRAELQEKSYIGKMGHFIEPVIKPLGFDWRMGISIITGISAKEIIVGTMGVLYHADLDADKETTSLAAKLQNAKYTEGDKKGQNIYNPAVALSFMLFILLYFPCIGTLVVIARETGSWKWGLFTVFYTTSVAWIVSFLVYQIGCLFL